MRGKLLFVLLFTAGLMAFQAPAEVSISLDTSGSQPTVVVSPSTIQLSQGQKLRWVSSGSNQDSVEITFDSQYGKAGPFPSENSSANPQRGRYHKRVGSSILTTAATDKGQWKYTVTWTTASGTSYPLDPIVVIR